MKKLKILFLEPYHGGSHREFALGLSENSRHDLALHTLPARNWKWRMRGAALHFALSIEKPQRFDGLLLSDMASLADLKGVWGNKCPPAILYCHENQLSYPSFQQSERDIHFSFSNISSMLAADRVVFNSRFQRDSFFGQLPRLLARMPDYRLPRAEQNIWRKQQVIYPGCRFYQLPARPNKHGKKPPLIIWNHRWEYDKNPQLFFKTLYRLQRQGTDFRLALLGANPQTQPKLFEQAIRQLGDKIIRTGYENERQRYLEWLSRGDVVVSAAIQENFGIAVLEAAAAGCYPLLPNRLSYPEVIAEKYHRQVLYDDSEQLFFRLQKILSQRLSVPAGLAESVRTGYDWSVQIEPFDTLFEQIFA